MNKTKLLKLVKKLAKENETDFQSDSGTEQLFHNIDMKIDLLFELNMHYTGDDSWLEVFYYSKKLGKNILWNYDVGNFDDADELTDFIINTSKEIRTFERKLIKI